VGSGQGADILIGQRRQGWNDNSLGRPADNAVHNGGDANDVEGGHRWTSESTESGKGEEDKMCIPPSDPGNSKRHMPIFSPSKSKPPTMMSVAHEYILG